MPPCDGEAPSALEGHRHVALYQFEEAQGPTLADTTRIGQGTMFGILPGEGQCGGGANFVMADAHLELSSVGEVFQRGIAVGLWVRPQTVAAGQVHLVGDGGGGIATFQLVLDGGIPVLRIADSINAWRELVRGTDALEPDVWQYVMATYDLNVASLFVDGDEVASTTVVYRLQGSYNTIFAGAIRAVSCCGFEHQFVGSLDEIAIYARR